MFKNLKQKIAEGVEGVTPGRQTPLQANREKNASTPSASGGTPNQNAKNTPTSARESRRSVSNQSNWNIFNENSTFLTLLKKCCYLSFNIKTV